MKTKLLALFGLFILAVNVSYAQVNEEALEDLKYATPDEFITEVIGIDFGTPKIQARKKIIEQLGTPTEEDLLNIRYVDITYGNVEYDLASFGFSESTGNPLNSLQLACYCYSQVRANEIVEKIRKDLAEDYTLVHMNQPFMANSIPATLNYVGGRSKSIFYGFTIATMKTTDEDDEEMYLVTLNYGPYSY